MKIETLVTTEYGEYTVITDFSYPDNTFLGWLMRKFWIGIYWGIIKGPAILEIRRRKAIKRGDREFQAEDGRSLYDIMERFDSIFIAPIIGRWSHKRNEAYHQSGLERAKAWILFND